MDGQYADHFYSQTKSLELTMAFPVVEVRMIQGPARQQQFLKVNKSKPRIISLKLPSTQNTRHTETLIVHFQRINLKQKYCLVTSAMKLTYNGLAHNTRCLYFKKYWKLYFYFIYVHFYIFLAT